MAVERTFIKHFEDADGLEYRASDLTRDKQYFKDMKNFRYSYGYSLRGREGCQNFAPPGGFLSFHNFTYTDLVNGGTVQEMIAINDHLWRLRTANLTVTGGANLNYTVRLNTGTSTYRFVINNNSSPYTLSGNNYLDLGNGTEATPITIETLRASIDANASLACALPSGIEFAQVNGNQVGVSTVTVFAGHTLAVGDVIQFWDYSQSKLTWRIVTATTGTTFSFDSSWGTVNVNNNQILGPMATPAASVAVADAFTSASGTLNIPFSYWDPVPHVTGRYAPFRSFWASRANANWKHACFVNADNKVYIFTESPGQTQLAGHEGYPHYYDGLKVARAGVPRIDGNISIGLAAGAIPAGTYKWKFRYAKQDNNGITYYGQPTTGDWSTTTAGPRYFTLTVPMPKFCEMSPSTFTLVNGPQVGVSTIAVTGTTGIQIGDSFITLNQATGNFHEDIITGVNSTTNTITISTAINVNNGQTIYVRYPAGFDDRGLVKNAGAQTNVNTITVSTGEFVRAGEQVLISDANPALTYEPPYLVSRTLTASSPTSITWSGTSANFAGGDQISTSMWIEIYRTKNGGNKYYFISKIPVKSHVEQITFTDDYTDADLGFYGELDEPAIGQELDLPPRAAIGCLHQGAMVYSRIDDNPNQLGFSDLVGGLEAVPLASNYFDIPSNVYGAITAIGSDSYGRLAVFKNSAYYDVQGDLVSYSFGIRSVTEGDYGVASHASLCRVNGRLVGIGYLGFVAIRDGQRDIEFGDEVSLAVVANRDIDVSRAIAINDYTRQQYLCYIPPLVSGSGLQLLLRLDYGYNDRWFNWFYAQGYDPSGGMIVYNNLLYHLSLASLNGLGGRCFRRVDCLLDPKQNYSDNHTLIDYQLRTQPEHDGSPQFDKTFLRMVVYSFYAQYEQSLFTPFSLRVRTYRNFQESVVDTDKTISFSAISETYKPIVLSGVNKAKALGLLFSNVNILECPQITGYELTVLGNYKREDPTRF